MIKKTICYFKQMVFIILHIVNNNFFLLTLYCYYNIITSLKICLSQEAYYGTYNSAKNH